MKLQSSVFAIRKIQIKNGVPVTQLARNVLPMRILVQLAILEEMKICVENDMGYDGSSSSSIRFTLESSNYALNSNSVNKALRYLKSQKILNKIGKDYFIA